jgi:chemotaxis signal transduction protein
MSADDHDGTARWARLRERLDRVRAGMAAAGERTPEQERAILVARARALAEQKLPHAPDDAEPMVLVRIGGERFAIPAADVCEAFRLSAAAMLPGAAPPLVAVTVHRGELLMLIDIRRASPSVPRALEGAMVVVAQARGERTGVLVDEVIGMESMAAGDVHPRRGEPRAHVRGVTAGAVTVLETNALSRAQI